MKQVDVQAAPPVATTSSEINHRVMNAMQTLQSLISMVQRETESAEGRALLAVANRRIAAVAAAQKATLLATGPRFAARILIEALVRNESRSWGRQADIAADIADGDLPHDAAIPLGLIVGELVDNAVLHGRAGRAHVVVRVGFARDGADWQLVIADDGPGYDFEPSRRRASGLGLLATLVQQLGGTFAVRTDSGARCEVRFPVR